jgi:hypothetical protein
MDDKLVEIISNWKKEKEETDGGLSKDNYDQATDLFLDIRNWSSKAEGAELMEVVKDEGSDLAYSIAGFIIRFKWTKKTEIAIHINDNKNMEYRLVNSDNKWVLKIPKEEMPFWTNIDFNQETYNTLIESLLEKYGK